MGKKGKKSGGGEQTGPPQPPGQDSNPQPGPSAPQPTTATQQDSQQKEMKSEKEKEKAAQVQPPPQVQQAPAPAEEETEEPEPGAAAKKKKKKKKKSASAQDTDEATQPSDAAPAPAPAQVVKEEPQQPPGSQPAETEETEQSGGAAKKKKKKKKTAQDKDEAAPPGDAAPAQAGTSQQAGKGQDKKGGAGDAAGALSGDLKKMSVSSSIKCKYAIPPRKRKKPHDFSTCTKSNDIEVNYLPIKIQTWNLNLYHYDVIFNPDKPKYLYRDALQVFIRNNFPNRHPAFDGKKNLYAGGTHLFDRDSVRDSVEIPDPENANRTKTFDITVKRTPQKINMAQLKKYIAEGKSQDIPQDVVQATDIALRSGLYSRFIPCSRSFFSGPMKPCVPLGEGMELYDGFFQSAIMGQGGVYLNVDVSNKAFPIDQKVLDYIRTDLQVNNLTDDEVRRVKKPLEDYLKGLKILYEVQGDKRTYRVNGLGTGTAITHRFTPEGKREMCVAEYFSTVKRINLQFPKLPLLHVGPPQKLTMVPLEFCKIIGRQVVMRRLNEKQTAAMVKAAARPTDERRARIRSSVDSAKYQDNMVLNREFGITVNTQFHKVKSWVFKAPNLKYSSPKPVTPRNGEWKGERFLTPAPGGILKWAILIKDFKTNEGMLRDRNGFITFLMSTRQIVGINIEQPCDVVTSTNPRNMNQRAIESELTELNKKHNGLQIVVVILPGGPFGSRDVKEAYGNVKRASEFQCGVLTQCLKARTVGKLSSATVVNILLKMNAKVNGVNHGLTGPLRPPVLNAPVMFVGGDVTHPAPGTEGSPSIAAVAASFEKEAFRYKMLYGLQDSRQEIIVDLEAMMVKMLEHFMKSNNNRLPRRILYYRDGVSEGQFSQVLDAELDAMRNACKKFPNCEAKITFLVVQKRHHTRFFPQKGDGDESRNNNVVAGTVVDTDITHPTEMDFYLVSHKSIQGTARPTKYHLLYDENDFDCEELEMLTYYLCYMFARCNRSVSYPAPTYYAHLAAFRARAWWDGQNPDLQDLRRDQMNRGTIHTAIGEGYPMFFV